MDNCKNCSHELTGPFCSSCGQALQLKRIDGHYILHEIVHVLHFEKGILYTIRELIIRPGENIRDFLSVNRSRLVKPIIFIIVSSLIYTLVTHFFHIKDVYIRYDEGAPIKHSNINYKSIATMVKWIQDHYGYSNIIMAMFIAFWIKLFFRRYNYNFFEILILLCFVIGMEMLIYSVFAIIEGFTKVHLMKISGILSIIYCSWAIGQFFDQTKYMSYLKAISSFILGMITFFLSIIFIGLLIGLLTKY